MPSQTKPETLPRPSASHQAPGTADFPPGLEHLPGYTLLLYTGHWGTEVQYIAVLKICKYHCFVEEYP